MSTQNNFKKFSLPVSLLISLFFIFLAYSLPSFSPDRNLKIGFDVVQADTCSYCNWSGDVPTGNQYCGPGSTDDDCNVCYDADCNSNGGPVGGGVCSGWDGSGNWFELSCGAPNTHSDDFCGSPCDIGCGDRNNCNICPQTCLLMVGSCIDGIQNQDETGVDTGGVCPAGVDGGWTAWSFCTGSCGGGAGIQDRTCTDPEPSGSGADCVGPASQSCVNNTPCGATDASLDVTSNLSTSWTVSSSGWSNNSSGTSKSYTVYPDTWGHLYSINPASLAGYTLAVTNSVTGAGSSFSLFNGDSGTFFFTYTPIATFNYSLSSQPSVAVTKLGVNAFGQMVITETLTAGTGQNVTLAVSGVPAGVSYAVSPSSGCSPNCSSTITFTVTPSTVSGTYPITVTGSPLSKTVNFNLVIQNSSSITVTCSASPSTVVLIGQPVTWSASASGGNGGPYTYSWSGTNVPTSPAPSTQSFQITYSTIGQKVAQVTVRDSVNNVGNCSGGGSGATIQVNFNPQFKEF